MWNITRVELASMFYSPIAWLLLVIFAVQSFSVFIGAMQALNAIDASMGIQGGKTGIFVGNIGVLKAMAPKLLYYIPLLTMGIIAREIHSGSIKLLLSSPVNIRQIIMGKYLAMMIYCALLMGMLLILMLVAGSVIENFEFLWVLGGILGLYLLMCVYASIGVFMSSLTQHQVVAAISTLTVLFLLSAINGFGRTIPVISELTYWLSLDGRVSSFVDGLITSQDILYFILIIGMFLSFALLKLSAGRKIESRGKKASNYVGVLLVTISLGYVTARPTLTGYWDVTRSQYHTLSADSLKVIDSVREKKWKLTAYVNLLDGMLFRYGHPLDRIRERTLLPIPNYTRYLPYLETEVKVYYKKQDQRMFDRAHLNKSELEAAQEMAEQYGIDFNQVMSVEEIKDLDGVDLSNEEGRYIKTIEVDGRKTLLRVFVDALHYPLETEITVAFNRLLQGATKTAFVTGHDERSPYAGGSRNFNRAMTSAGNRNSRLNQGFDIVDTNLASPIAQDVDILVIADPRTAYSEIEQQNLREYIARGGNLLIAGDLGRQDKVNPLIKELGVELMLEQILQKNEGSVGDGLRGTLNINRKVDHIGLSKVNVIATNKTVGLNYDPALKADVSHPNFVATHLYVVSGSNVWSRKGTVDLEIQALSFNPATDTKEEFTLVMALTRQISGKEQRIIVLGDADVLTAGDQSAQFYNWLGHDVYPLDHSKLPATDLNMSIGRKGFSILKIIFYGVVPGVILLFGFGLLYRRKRR